MTDPMQTEREVERDSAMLWLRRAGWLELLELAAKAAGKPIRWDGDVCVLTEPDWSHDKCSAWNPLTDDGDALRLAVKLCMTIHRNAPHAVCAGWGVGTPGAPTIDGLGPWFWKEWLPEQADEAQATRYAIVHAAAQLGMTK